MKERPILFSGEMVRAILDGRKCQTRRVVGDVPVPATVTHFEPWFVDGERQRRDSGIPLWVSFEPDGTNREWGCRYGEEGDRLWVRETWIKNGHHGEVLIGRVDYGAIAYRADGHKLPSDYCWKPSIHMPRKFSRITLEVTAVRVERVQDINHDDAQAEGLPCYHDNHECALDHFKELWNEVNGKRGHLWADNPWVWVVEFRPFA